MRSKFVLLWGVNINFPACANFFQIMFQSFSILFCCIVLFSYGSQKRSEDRKREWEVNSHEEIPNQEEGLHIMICTTQRGPPATEIKGCQPQAEGFKQLARTKYVTRYIYVSVSSSCSSSCLLCSFSCSSSSLHLDVTAYILQTIFDVITFTVTCFHLSLFHSYSI